MSIPGTNLETAVVPDPVDAPDPNAPEPAHDDDEGIVEAVSVGGQKMVPLAELIKYRQQAKTLKTQLGELQPEIERMKVTAQQVEEIRPYADAIRQNPKLIDLAQQATRPSAASTIQPEEDQEAKDTAEDLGLYHPQTGELDVARARRVLNRANANAERRMQAQIEPIRRSTVEGQAAVMRQRVQAMRDKAGAPIASDESLNEMFGLLPPELVANPQVAFVVALAAAGADKYNGRTPKAVQAQTTFADPLYTEPVGRRGTSAVNEELAAMMKKVGLTDADMKPHANHLPGKPIRLED